ncbi:hypothetical protein [Wohlfahrtiimonas larvae]|uniref:Uncharacterized protein n=1 Tax=Wohlfahrtiimonas larvae TaxID=1157986 RepID=A0ABP9MQQ8_9GAMM|nr:hypothetical protein [Wohlfahrtiimonas larvae]
MKILRDFKVGQQHFRRGGMFVKPSVLTDQQVDHLVRIGYLEDTKAAKQKEKNK